MSAKPEPKLDAILDLPALQAMADQFHALTGFGMSIRDLQGKVLLSAGGQEICTKFHRIHPESCKHCEESEKTLCSDVPPGTFKRYRCKNNLWDMATPIIVGSHKMGHLFMGQFLLEEEPLNLDIFRSQAKRYGFDEEAYLKALDRVPHWNRLKVDQAMTFYVQFAQQIAEQGFRNLQLARALDEQKNIEEALQESEQLYHSILNASPDDITITDLEGRILIVSPSSVQMFGYETENQIVGRRVLEFIIPEERDRAASDIAHLFQRITSGPIGYRGEYQGMRADGHTFDIEVNGEFIRDAKGQPSRIILVVRDVSARKQAENHLRLQARLLDAVQESVVATNLHGLIQYWGQGAKRLFGYSAEEVIGQPYRAFAGSIAPPNEEEFRNLILTQGFWHGEHVQKNRQGDHFWTSSFISLVKEENGQPAGFIGIDQDITERKRSEEQVRQLLEESNQSRQALLGILEDQVRADADRKRLSAAIEQSAESILVTDANAQIQYVNPAFEKVSGYTREEAIGQNPRMLGSGQQTAEFYRELWATLSSGKTWHGRFINRRKDGALYTEDALISPVCDDAGKIVSFVAVKRDITEQLRVTEQLQQAQKMDSIGRLAGGIAHDFNNMLGVILGHTELAMELVSPDNPLHGDLVEIQKAAERSAALTRQLLAFARKQAATPKMLNLNETIEGMINMLRRLMGENIELSWKPQPDLWPIQMDPSQIDQILANLCVNARDAIADVGQITIETHNIVFRPSVADPLPDATPGDFVRIDFRDTGCGMTPETLGHIFEPFFSTKKKGLGSGLGLATVYGVVKQYNGFIQVHSQPAQGTTFHIYLPRHRGTLETQARSAPPPPPTGGHESILLVEDEPSILKITGQIIEGLGYTVRKANSPAEAIRLATEHGHEIDLLLTDVVMPEMNGRDLAQKLLLTHPKLKCLFMSGYTADVIARNGVLDKGVHFIEKPFTKPTLAAQIRKALDSALPSPQT